jgi:hypothetical protein
MKRLYFSTVVVCIILLSSCLFNQDSKDSSKDGVAPFSNARSRLHWLNEECSYLADDITIEGEFAILDTVPSQECIGYITGYIHRDSAEEASGRYSKLEFISKVFTISPDLSADSVVKIPLYAVVAESDLVSELGSELPARMYHTTSAEERFCTQDTSYTAMHGSDTIKMVDWDCDFYYYQLFSDAYGVSHIFPNGVLDVNFETYMMYRRILDGKSSKEYPILRGHWSYYLDSLDVKDYQEVAEGEEFPERKYFVKWVELSVEGDTLRHWQDSLKLYEENFAYCVPRVHSDTTVKIELFYPLSNDAPMRILEHTTPINAVDSVTGAYRCTGSLDIPYSGYDSWDIIEEGQPNTVQVIYDLPAIVSTWPVQ